MAVSTRDLLLLLVTLTLWGGYFVAGKYALELFPPLFLTGLRFAVVALVLLPWVGLPNIPLRQVFVLSIAWGVLNFGLGLAALGWGLDIATTIVVGQLGVPFSCMFGSILLKDTLGPWRTFGLVVAMLGAVTIAGTPNVSSNFAAFIALIVASAAWGLTNILMKRFGEVKIYPYLGWLGFFSCLQLFFVSFLFETGQIEGLYAMGWREFFGVVYLGLGATVVAYGIWYYLLHRYMASEITPYTMLGPFIAFAMGQVFFDEPISQQVLIAGAITLLGVGIIVTRRPRLAMLGKIVSPRFPKRDKD